MLKRAWRLLLGVAALWVAAAPVPARLGRGFVPAWASFILAAPLVSTAGGT